MAFGCFDGYKFDYSDELPQDFDQHDSEKIEFVAGGWLRAG
jgi:hypothetical protein